MALPACAVAVAAAVTLGACKTTSSTTRELPTNMGTLGSYLDGCAPDGDDDGIARMRCPDGIMVAVRTRTAGIGEPQYRSEAFGMAQLAGGRLVWDQVVVPTEGPSGLVDRARSLEPGSETANAELVGVVRSLGAHDLEEVWCTSSDEAGAVRCRDLLGAFLSSSTDGGAVSATNGNAGGAGAAAPATSTSPVTFFGRSLSLPTTCTAKKAGEGGDANCTDGASLSWRRFDEMEEATNIVNATLEALGDDSEGAAYPCTMGGETGQCEAHPRAAAGIAYVDGKPAAVLCLGVDGAKDHSLCRAILVPR